MLTPSSARKSAIPDDIDSNSSNLKTVQDIMLLVTPKTAMLSALFLIQHSEGFSR